MDTESQFLHIEGLEKKACLCGLSIDVVIVGLYLKEASFVLND